MQFGLWIYIQFLNLMQTHTFTYTHKSNSYQFCRNTMQLHRNLFFDDHLTKTEEQ